MALKLEKVVAELVQSEKAYLRDVELLIQIYLDPLRGKESAGGGGEDEDVSDLLSVQDINSIFSNIEQVLGINKALLQALEKDQSMANIAVAFTTMAEYLKVYSIYCSNQDSSLKVVEEMESKVPRFKRWMKDNQSKFLSRGLDLRDFLIKPTQRICKYPLFLRELIDNSPADSKSQQDLKAVDAKVQAVVSHINEQRRLKQGLDGVVEIFQKLATEYPLIKGQRVLVFKGSAPLRELRSTGGIAKSSTRPLTLSPSSSASDSKFSSFTEGFKR